MKIELTDFVSRKVIAIDPEKVRLIEPADNGGTHLSFDDKQGRIVAENYSDLKPFFDVISISQVGLKTLNKLR